MLQNRFDIKIVTRDMHDWGSAIVSNSILRGMLINWKTHSVTIFRVKYHLFLFDFAMNVYYYITVHVLTEVKSTSGYWVSSNNCSIHLLSW